MILVLYSNASNLLYFSEKNPKLDASIPIISKQRDDTLPTPIVLVCNTTKEV